MATAILNPIADAYIDSDHPDSNYGNSVHLKMGTPPSLPPGHQHALLRFDLSSIPLASAILDAQLRFYCTVPSILDGAMHAHLLTAEWAEDEVTWNHRDGASSWENPGGDHEETWFATFPAPRVTGMFYINVTDGVAERLGSGELNCLLRSAPANEGTCKAASKEWGVPFCRPRLEVEYSQTGRYNLYRGPTRDTVDFASRVGQAPPGSSAIAEFLHRHPVDSGTYCYCLKGAGPAGHETAPHETAFYEIEYADGVRVTPPPAAPLSVSVKPYRAGQTEFTVVVDQAAGRVPAATLHCYHNSGSGDVDYETQVGDDVPVPSPTGRHMLRFVVDPDLPHGTEVAWSVRAVSADDAEEENTETYSAVVDSEGPPAMSEFLVEKCDAL